jgi:L,D-transpeptidase YcbB
MHAAPVVMSPRVEMKMHRLAGPLAALLLMAAAPMPPAALAPETLRAAVKSASDTATLTTVYQRLDWTAAWTANNVAQLDAALAERAHHGLDLIEFLPPLKKPLTAAKADVARTKAALDYASALARGRVDPRRLYRIYTHPLPSTDLAAGLAGALRLGRLRPWLESLAPQDAEYRAMSRAYLVYRQNALSEAAPAIPLVGGPIEPGEADSRMPEIARQLVASGYLPADAIGATPPARLTEPISAAIRALQRDFGQTDDGVVGARTLALLNLGSAVRARATAISLERRRWLARNPPATRIDVNIAAADLSYWRDGKLVARRKVIVGRVANKTPQLLTPMFRLVANPSWTVPRSIQIKELANKSQAYFAAHNMELRNGRIVQRPGPSNALGLVKFDLRNDHAIYLHDTNARGLFERTQRQLSHGCVRVEDALGLAAMIARDQGLAEAWDAATRTGKESFVPLPREIPVRLLYHNVFVDPDGDVLMRTDPYDLNEDIARKLGFAGAWRATLRSGAHDIGP